MRALAISSGLVRARALVDIDAVQKGKDDDGHIHVEHRRRSCIVSRPDKVDESDFGMYGHWRRHWQLVGKEGLGYDVARTRLGDGYGGKKSERKQQERTCIASSWAPSLKGLANSVCKKRVAAMYGVASELGYNFPALRYFVEPQAIQVNRPHNSFEMGGREVDPSM